MSRLAQDRERNARIRQLEEALLLIVDPGMDHSLTAVKDIARSALSASPGSAHRDVDSVPPVFRGDGRCEVFDRGRHPEDYSNEARCPEPAVETMMYLHGAYDLRVCSDHLALFPAHALDLGPQAPVAGAEREGRNPKASAGGPVMP